MSRHNSLRQTEAVEFPVDWQVKSLREVTDFTNGKPYEADIKADGRFSLITLDSVDIKGQLKGTHRAIDVWDDSLRAGDIVSVLSDLAHGLLLGLSAVIPADNSYVLNQRMGRLRLKVPGSPAYLRLQINRRQDHFRMRGQGTSQRHIYKRDFDALEVPFPNSAEQAAIAEAISDADALLASLDRLIAKKRDLKQAAMQQLLTGQTRLPGFQEAWEATRLGHLLMRLSNGVVYRPSTGDGVMVTRIETIAAGAVDYARTGLAIWDRSMAQFALTKGDILFSHINSVDHIGKVALVPADDPPLFHGMNLLVMRAGPACSAEFLYFWLCLESTRRHMRVLARQAVSQASINTADLRSLALSVPAHDEQDAIAKVLTEMTNELIALEARRDKTQALKEGMMQELLTGRTRLV